MAVVCLGGGYDRLGFSCGPIYIGIHDIDSFVVSFSLVFLRSLLFTFLNCTLLFFFLWLLGGGGGGPSGYCFFSQDWVGLGWCLLF